MSALARNIVIKKATASTNSTNTHSNNNTTVSTAPRISNLSIEQFNSSLLRCSNCESSIEPINIYCLDCNSNPNDSKSSPSAAVLDLLCKSCNTGLHRPNKMQSHKRQLFEYHSSNGLTIVELYKQYKFLSFPQLPQEFSSTIQLIHLFLCTNCDIIAPNNYCLDCSELLCIECNRDLHAPKQKKLHIRLPFTAKFITAQSNTSKTIINIKTSNTITGNGNSSRSNSRPGSVHNGSRPESGSSTGSGSASTDSKSNNNSTVSTAVSNSNNNNNNIKSNKIQIISKPKSANTVNITNNNNSKTNNNTTSTNSVSLVSHISGDILHVNEISVDSTAELNANLLQCRNTFNSFDTIGNVQIVQICAGQSHCGAITAAGTLFMWGSNSDCQLGFDCGDSKECLEPTVVLLGKTEHRVKMIACGWDHSLALSQECLAPNNNTVWAFGNSMFGKCGNGSEDIVEIPTQIQWPNTDPAEQIIFVAAGQNNSGVIVRNRKDNKQLYIWGNNYGNIGTGDREPRLRPQLVSIDCGPTVTPLSDRYPAVNCLAFGSEHTIATTINGAVYTWGRGEFGQLGYILSGQSSDPTGGNAAAAAAMNLIQRQNSTTGSNSLIRMRTPLQTPRRLSLVAQPDWSDDSADLIQSIPRLVDSLRTAGVTAVSCCAGELVSGILCNDGSVWSWGAGDSHLLGIMDNIDQFKPVKAALLGSDNGNPEYKAISLAIGASAAAVVTATGDVYAYGYSVERPIPTLVPNLRSNYIQRVALGSQNNLVCLTSIANSVYEWRFLEDGDSDSTNSNNELLTAAGSGPVLNRQLRGKRLTAVAVGRTHMSLVTAAGKLLSWGSSIDNQMGTEIESSANNDEMGSYRPIELNLPYSIIDIKCGPEHSVALTSTGQVLTWGTASMGRLGHNDDFDQPKPKLIETLKLINIRSIAIGPHNTAAVSSNGELYIWGNGHAGCNGNNSTQPVLKPQLVKSLSESKVSIVQVAFGNRHAAAITDKGELYCFGDNSMGQLGLGSNSSHRYLIPQLNQLISNNHYCTAVACGDNTTFILTNKGTVYGFGQGETNQLCNSNSNSEDSFIPIQIPIGNNTTIIKSLSVSAINCSALTNTGEVYCWGYQLGSQPTRIDSLVRDGIQISLVSIGPSSLILST